MVSVSLMAFNSQHMARDAMFILMTMMMVGTVVILMVLVE